MVVVFQHMYLHIYIYTHMHINIYTYAYKYIHICIYVLHMYTYVSHIHVYIHSTKGGYKFSKVSSLLDLLNKLTIDLTFQNFYSSHEEAFQVHPQNFSKASLRLKFHRVK